MRGAPVEWRRAAELAEIGGRLRRKYFEGLVGTPLQVLVESPIADRSGVFLGTSDRYAPVELAGGEEQLGRLVWVTAQRVEADHIVAGELAGGVG